MMGETRDQLTTLFQNILAYPNVVAVLFDYLITRGLELPATIPIELPPTLTPDQRKFLIQKLQEFHWVQVLSHNHIPTEPEYRAKIPEILGTLGQLPGPNNTIDPEVIQTLGVLQVQLNNTKEFGITQFVGHCVESKTITSSVDMHNNYRRWCTAHGYNYCSAPTLTKYLRESEKRNFESTSDKGRSQGWYLTTP